MFEESSGIHLTVRTRAGRAIKKDANTEPFRSKECGRTNCFCCLSGNPGGCERSSVRYQIRCEACHTAGKPVVYEAETGRNTYSRGLEHQSNLRNKTPESPLWKHYQLEHGGQIQAFVLKTLKCFSGCFERQCNEDVKITESKAEIIMNSMSQCTLYKFGLVWFGLVPFDLSASVTRRYHRRADRCL